jgi:uncharacterized protein (DUF302 family)
MLPKNALVQIASRHSFNNTVQRLHAAFLSKGLQIFALIDHSGEAEKVG